MAGMCSSRFVEPPNAAWTTIALRIDGVGQDVAERVRPRRPERTRARAERRAMSRQIGWPEGASAECGSDMPERLGDHLRGRGGAQELAAAAGTGAGPAAELGRLGQRQLAVRIAGADRLDLARVFALARRQRHAAGDEHAGQMPRPGQGQHHRRQSLVAGRDAEHALAPGQRADRAGGRRSRRRCDRAGCPSSRPSPASGRRKGRRPSRRRARHRAAAAPRPPPAPAGRSPSGPYDTPARSASRRRRAGPPGCSGSENGSRSTSRGVQPIPAFWLSPNRSPEGQWRSISSVSGSVPAGPSAFVITS